MFYFLWPFRLNFGQFEQAVRAWETGQFVDPGNFNAVHNNGQMKDYYATLNSFLDRHWQVILEACGISPDSDENELNDKSVLNQQHRRIYVSSSPLRD